MEPPDEQRAPLLTPDQSIGGSDCLPGFDSRGYVIPDIARRPLCPPITVDSLHFRGNAM
jgi:hypothetical protein